jgi:glyoxylase-like metal-dependent hydrolase (beta-lactamase superfamily II)
MLKTNSFGPVTRFDLARTIPGQGPYWTTCYYVDGLLVDSGCAHAKVELVKALEGSPLEGIVNTHTHEDHIGANAILQSRDPQLKIFAHPLALPVLADPHGAQPLHPYRRLFWGWPEPSKARPLANGEIIQTARYRLQVIYTPGHSPDHICLFEEQQGWLFSGDLFVGGQDRALRAGCDIWMIIEALKRIQTLPVGVLFPGSARVRQTPQAEIAAKIDYLEDLGRRVINLWRQGYTVDRICKTVLGGPMWVEFVTRGHFSRRWLVRSYLRQDEIRS